MNIFTYPFIISLALLSLKTLGLPQECSNLWIQNQDCSWYLDCLEQKYHCGPNGYPQGYGYKYCSKFSQLKFRADPAVVSWIQETTICLKQNLKHFLLDDNQFAQSYKNSKTCSQLKKQAFKSHPVCYTSSGFCAIWRKLGVKKSAKFLDELLSIFELKDFVSFVAIKQILVTFEICSGKN